MVNNESIVVLPGKRMWSLGGFVCEVPRFADIGDFVSRSENSAFFALPTIGSTLTACLLLVSCANFTEDELAERGYDREDKLILAMENYAIKKESCQSRGESMVINRFSSSRLSKLTAQEHKLAQCVGY